MKTGSLGHHGSMSFPRIKDPINLKASNMLRARHLRPRFCLQNFQETQNQWVFSSVAL